MLNPELPTPETPLSGRIAAAGNDADAPQARVSAAGAAGPPVATGQGPRLDDAGLVVLAALAEGATDGEWRVTVNRWIDAGKYDEVLAPAPVDCMTYCYGGTSKVEISDADLALIVAAVNTLPALVAEVQRLRTVEAAVEALLEAFAASERRGHLVERAVTNTANAFREQYEAAKARNALMPPHARMVVTDPTLSAHVAAARTGEASDG